MSLRLGRWNRWLVQDHGRLVPQLGRLGSASARGCGPCQGAARSVGVSVLDEGRPVDTALLSHQPLGSAEVTHPFHPLRGQRFVVLKVRRVAGVETLSLRHHDLGSFAIAREWTDWAPPGAPAVSAGKSLTIDAFGLLSLTELVTSLTRNGGLDR
jgi:Family of unknown function (DUF5372)